MRCLCSRFISLYQGPAISDNLVPCARISTETHLGRRPIEHKAAKAHIFCHLLAFFRLLLADLCSKNTHQLTCTLLIHTHISFVTSYVHFKRTSPGRLLMIIHQRERWTSTPRRRSSSAASVEVVRRGPGASCGRADTKRLRLRG